MRNEQDEDQTEPWTRLLIAYADSVSCIAQKFNHSRIASDFIYSRAIVPTSYS